MMPFPPPFLEAKPKSTLCVTTGERLPSQMLFHTVIYDGFSSKKSRSQDGSPIGGFSAGFLVLQPLHDAHVAVDQVAGLTI